MLRALEQPRDPIEVRGFSPFGGGAICVQHWPPDADRDVAAEANRPDRAPCREIRVCPGLARRLRRLAVVVDVTIPKSPGYAIYREAP